MSIILDGTTGITTPDLIDSSLTSGRVVYAGASGNLTGSSALTFDGTNLSNTRSVATAFSGTNSATWANGIALTNSATPATGVASLINFGGANNVNSVFGVAQSSSGFGDFVWAGYSGSFSEQMRLTSTGLGIGTSSPRGILDLSRADSVNAVQLYLENTSTSEVGLRIRRNGSDIGFVGTAAWSITGGGSTNFGINAVNALLLGVGSTERARIDSSGNFNIGTTTAQITSAGRGNITLNGSSSAIINLSVGDVNKAQFYHGGTDMFIGNQANGYLMFQTNATERARIDSSGNLLVGTTSVASGGGVICAVQSANLVASDIRATNASFTSSVINLEASRNTTNTSYYFFSGTITGIQTKIRIADSGNITNVNGSYGTISDAKLKTDIVDAGSQWADIKAVKFRKFKMIDDPDQRVQLGVIAQEIEQVSAGLIEEHTDRDADENDLGTTTKSVKTSVLLMKAAVALQEAMTRIEQLEARLDAANL